MEKSYGRNERKLSTGATDEQNLAGLISRRVQWNIGDLRVVVRGWFLMMMFAQIGPEFLDHVGRQVVSHLRAPGTNDVAKVALVAGMIAVRRNSGCHARAKYF